jgi:hypothetical protein
LAPTVGIAATGFCYLGGILKFFIDKISKFCGCRQQQQPDRIERASSVTRDGQSADFNFVET